MGLLCFIVIVLDCNVYYSNKKIGSFLTLTIIFKLCYTTFLLQHFFSGILSSDIRDGVCTPYLSMMMIIIINP